MIEESLNKAIKRIQKRKKMQEAVPLVARMAAGFAKNKALIKAKKGIKKPNKGGALVTTKGSAIKKAGSSSMTPVKDARAGITKPEPEAKDQTINVKATEVGGDLAKSKSGGVTKSKVGSMSNSGKKTVDPKKNTVTSGAQQGAKSPEVLSKDSKERDLRRDVDQNSAERRRKKAEKAEAEAKAKRSRIAKGVKSAAKSAIGGAAAAYGSSSFNVREGRTFAQFIDDAVVLDEEMPGDGIMKGNVLMKGLETAAPYIRKGISLGSNIFQSFKRRRNKDKSGESGKSLEQRANAKNTQGEGGSPGQVYAGKNRNEKGDPLPDAVKQKIINILNKNKKNK